MQNIFNTNINSFKISLDNKNNNSMFLFPITEEELIDVVNKSRNKKLSDCNELGMKMTKNY